MDWAGLDVPVLYMIILYSDTSNCECWWDRVSVRV